MRLSFMLPVALAGCYHPTVGLDAPCTANGQCPSGLTCVHGLCVGGEGLPDGQIIGGDAPVPIDGCTTFSQQVDTCQLGAGSPVTLTGFLYEYHTDTGRLVELDAADMIVGTTYPAHVMVNGKAGPIDVLVASAFTLAAGSELDPLGPVPFGIVASDVATVAGRLDATAGAGHRNAAACGSAAGTDGGGNVAGGSGGGGGAFQTAGAGGGAGAAAGGNQGIAVAAPAGPLGGCPGGAGGAGITVGSPGGQGGGAVFIAAAVRIDVPIGGIINAAGDGGSGGAGGAAGTPGYLAGGGGGGGGGMIWLEAPLVSIRGAITANGGGGGEASGSTHSGQDGRAGRFTASPASGGAGLDPAGGDGGAGAALNVGAAPGGSQTSGGGGGGGVGFITIRGTKDLAGGVVSPPAL